jgi:peptidoglycan endopeptidase LytF
MRLVLLLLTCLCTINAYSQHEQEDFEEFVPINIEGKEAFMSSKTGEFIFREHANTDPTALKTTNEGVVYSDITIHTVKKSESLFSIGKKYSISVLELKKFNGLKTNNLKIGQKLKIKKKLLIKSSSPIVSYAGEERIIARLNPGQSPYSLNPPAGEPSSTKPYRVDSTSIETENTEKNKVEENSATKIKSVHIVKSGETLFSIAKKYNITVQELKVLNDLSLNNLNIGQKLKLQ